MIPGLFPTLVWFVCVDVNRVIALGWRRLCWYGSKPTLEFVYGVNVIQTQSGDISLQAFRYTTQIILSKNGTQKHTNDMNKFSMFSPGSVHSFCFLYLHLVLPP
ncbi:hypothetical protein ATANTOWER_020432 [Ataeniobius toweri]|uniref:Secreted protein n=1 Tax=Ataeniobius toweri TaxID=208326 RepID=A0ABU7A7F3_9TELE|nr:hypothetical protein [Ataeniobius toweri]